MSEIRDLSESVTEFLSRASDDYGRVMAERFSQDMFCELVEGAINSPIEDLFYLAVHVLSKAAYYDVNPDPVFDERAKAWRVGFGVHVIPQAKIGKYRVDFLIECTDGQQPNRVIVELDGHAFHDKDKAQRAYEKGRDRFLVKEGYRVLHYTGSEVFADPYKVAHEALSLLGATESSVYDASNPIAVG